MNIILAALVAWGCVLGIMDQALWTTAIVLTLILPLVILLRVTREESETGAGGRRDEAEPIDLLNRFG